VSGMNLPLKAAQARVLCTLCTLHCDLYDSDVSTRSHVVKTVSAAPECPPVIFQIRSPVTGVVTRSIVAGLCSFRDSILGFRDSKLGFRDSILVTR